MTRRKGAHRTTLPSPRQEAGTGSAPPHYGPVTGKTCKMANRCASSRNCTGTNTVALGLYLSNYGRGNTRQNARLHGLWPKRTPSRQHERGGTPLLGDSPALLPRLMEGPSSTPLPSQVARVHQAAPPSRRTTADKATARLRPTGIFSRASFARAESSAIRSPSRWTGPAPALDLAHRAAVLLTPARH